MLGLRRIIKLLRHTKTNRMFLAYLLVLLAGGVLMYFIEPGVNDIFDGFYFLFVASTTIGFGDIVPVTVIGKIITMIVSLIGILTVAMVPGVVVAYYTEYLKLQEKDTISTFLEKLEHLPDMDKDELLDLSERVKQFNKNKRGKIFSSKKAKTTDEPETSEEPEVPDEPEE